jgi:hypothetical protein
MGENVSMKTLQATVTLNISARLWENWWFHAVSPSRLPHPSCRLNRNGGRFTSAGNHAAGEGKKRAAPGTAARNFL